MVHPDNGILFSTKKNTPIFHEEMWKKLSHMILKRWMNAIVHLPKPIECTRARVNPNINYGLWVIMMSQCRFINCNKRTTVVGDAGSGEAVHVCG